VFWILVERRNGKLMSIKQSKDDGFGGHHAVVIGTSMAGLMAGRVLSDHFECVTLIERDRLPEDAEPRRGAPQGQHIHVLLKKGASLLTELFPDLPAALAQGGAPYLDSIADVRWYHFGVWKARFPSTIKGYSQSRPFLEQCVRLCLATKANVRFMDQCEVTRLCANDDKSRITGVHVRHRNGEYSEEELAADLVVDASGRGSQAPQWLLSLGYEHVKESKVKVDIGYASRIYRRPREFSPDWKVLVIYPTPPAGKRAGYVVPIEDNCWIVSLTGWLRNYPPNDEASFLDYARSLPEPTLYEVIKDAEPLTAIVTHRFPANQRRHYERMSRFPEGLIILGDAVCSFNPIYGQGMTTAALEASILNECLCRQQGLHCRGNVAGLAQHFQKAIAKVVDAPWLLATSEDFRYPETEGHRPPGIRLLNWYTGRLHELVSSHQVATLRFYEVLHMLKPPMALFDLRILFAVLFRRRSSQPDMDLHYSLQQQHPIEEEPLKS
jgi:2-polyprenyl-6-methoxyphenol hydroxylase-like FAD-dependent oxidoreductase